MKCSCFPALDATGREIHTPSCESRMTAEAELADRKRELVAVIAERNNAWKELEVVRMALQLVCDTAYASDGQFFRAVAAAREVLSSPSPQPKGA